MLLSVLQYHSNSPFLDAGEYLTDLSKALFSQEIESPVKQGRFKVNLNRCLTVNCPCLCEYHLLSASERKKVREAEAKVATAFKNKPAMGGTTKSRSGECYDASIVKPCSFMGNNGEIFKLDIGSLWEVKFEYEYMYEYYPEAIICPSKGTLVIDGKSLNVEHVGGR